MCKSSDYIVVIAIVHWLKSTISVLNLTLVIESCLPVGHDCLLQVPRKGPRKFWLHCRDHHHVLKPSYKWLFLTLPWCDIVSAFVFQLATIARFSSTVNGSMLRHVMCAVMGQAVSYMYTPTSSLGTSWQCNPNLLRYPWAESKTWGIILRWVCLTCELHYHECSWHLYTLSESNGVRIHTSSS